MFNNATAYNGYVGRWSRFAGEQFVTWLGIPPEKIWVDVGAGTGVLTQVILRQADARKVVAIDISESYIEQARRDVQDTRVEFMVGDVSHLISGTPEFDAAVAGLVLNFVPSAEQMVRHMKRLVKVGGTVAAYVWDYAGRMEMMRHFWEAAITVDPSAAALDSAKQFPICNADHLRALFETIGLGSVEVTSIDLQTTFKDFDDYWLPFLGAQGSVSKYLLSLDTQTTRAITAQLHQQLPINSDGSIELIARALAVKGVVTTG